MTGKTNAAGTSGNTGVSIPLEAPTNLALSAEDSKILLTWTDPNDKYTETYNELVSQWSYDSLVRKQGSAPTSVNDGTLVAKITGKNQYQNIPYVDTGMENDKEWFYSVFAHNQFNTPSDPIYGSEIPTATVTIELINYIWGDCKFGNPNLKLIHAGNGLYYTQITPSTGSIRYLTHELVSSNTTSPNSIIELYLVRPLVRSFILLSSNATSYYIDSNFAFHDLTYYLHTAKSSSNRAISSGIDDLCQFVIDPGASCVLRIDTNYVAAMADTNRLGSTHYYFGQSSKNYAYFFGAPGAMGTTQAVIAYDQNSVYHEIVETEWDYLEYSTRCGTNTMFWDGTGQSENIYVVSSGLVASTISKPDISSIGPDGYDNFATVLEGYVDTYTENIGIATASTGPNSSFNQYITGIVYFDKNLMYRGPLSGFPPKPDESHLSTQPPPGVVNDCTNDEVYMDDTGSEYTELHRVGKYLLSLEYLVMVSNGSILVMKQGYDNNS